MIHQFFWFVKTSALSLLIKNILCCVTLCVSVLSSLPNSAAMVTLFSNWYAMT